MDVPHGSKIPPFLVSFVKVKICVKNYCIFKVIYLIY